MEGGFFVVGDAVGGGEDGGFYEGEAHGYNMMVQCVIVRRRRASSK